MAALFNDLHDVSQVLSEHIAEETGIADVQAGNPRLVGASSAAAARITLLYTSPQPSHRNDPPERQPDGSLRPPPLALSCFYLITTSGADGDDPIAAHHALGRIMTLYQDVPVLQLPLSENPGSPPGAFTELGDGQLGVTQVPMQLDQIDKIWTSMDVQLQPWALFEVAPVQLRSRLPESPPAPLVLPGGIAVDVRVGDRPAIVRLTPQPVRQQGRLRIEASAPPETVVAGGFAVPAAPLLTLDHGGLEQLGPGAYTFTVRRHGLSSRSATLRIAEADAPVIDAVGTHSRTAELPLAGANLSLAQTAMAWPDAGVNAPSDVHELAITAVTPTSLRVTGLNALDPNTYRLAIRIGAHVFTPCVVLELTA